MPKNYQQNSHHKLLQYGFEIMKANEHFLYENAQDVYSEVIELLNDAIDGSRLIISKENYSSGAMSFFWLHILMSQSYGMYIDLLIGNLPICFIELRLMVETLAKCLYADHIYSTDDFFGEKFAELDQQLKRRRITIAKVVRDTDSKLGTEDKLSDLWRRLSQNWVHSEGIMKRLIDYVAKRDPGKSGIPPWSLTLPMNYDRSDLSDLTELGRDIAQFRKILDISIDGSLTF